MYLIKIEEVYDLGKDPTELRRTEYGKMCFRKSVVDKPRSENTTL